MSSGFSVFRRIVVYLFEPNPLLRKLLNLQLKACGGGKIVNITQEDHQFASSLNGATSIVILDRGTLGPRFRMELQAVTLGLPGGRIAVIDNEMRPEDLSALIRLGVHAFLSYQSLDKELALALVRLRNGDLWFPTGVMEHYIKTTMNLPQSDECRRTGAFTPRQHQIMAMLRKGLSNKEIGSALNISESTVKFHLAKLFDKLGVNDRRAILLLPSNRIKSFGFSETEEQCSMAPQ